jgi:hypothetical protein
VTDPWARRLLYLAGAYNVIGGVSAIIDPASHFAQLYTSAAGYAGALALDDPLQVFFYRVAWINAIAWGVAYVVAGRLPASRPAVLIAGCFGKVVYCVACIALFRSGVGNAMLLGTGVVDVVFAALFVSILRATPRSRATSYRQPTTS